MPVNNGPTLASGSMGNDGFFGSVLSGIGEGLSRIGSDVLPVWTAQQLELQKDDALFRETFDPEGKYGRRRVDDAIQPIETAQPQNGNGILDTAWIQFGGVSIDGLTVLLLAGGIIAGWWFIGKAR